jgi:hypothetical protein
LPFDFHLNSEIFVGALGPLAQDLQLVEIALLPEPDLIGLLLGKSEEISHPDELTPQSLGLCQCFLDGFIERAGVSATGSRFVYFLKSKLIVFFLVRVQFLFIVLRRRKTLFFELLAAPFEA